LVLVITEVNDTLRVSYSAGRGETKRIIEFLDAESSGQEEAAESYGFLAMHYPGRRTLLKAVFEYSEGVHILRQPALETAVGYLLSVQSSVALVGVRLEAIARLLPANARVVEGQQLRFFPTLAQLKTLSASAVGGLRLGYRTRWFLELLARIPDEQGLEELRGMRSAEWQHYFRSYVGIGPKVAACN
jgi:3-methyladenine DNA glycosylase/8-oxoguanine DNA glycosylase